MKKVLLICNLGMSSSLMAKKTTDLLNEQGHDIKIEATTISAANKYFESEEYSLILVSPQIRMKFDEFSKKAEKFNKNIAQVTFNAYAPIPSGVEAMAKIVLDNI